MRRLFLKTTKGEGRKVGPEGNTHHLFAMERDSARDLTLSIFIGNAVRRALLDNDETL